MIDTILLGLAELGGYAIGVVIALWIISKVWGRFFDDDDDE